MPEEREEFPLTYELMSSSDEEDGERIHKIKNFINSPTLRHVKEVNLFLLVSIMALSVGLIHIHNTTTSSIAC